MFEIVWAHRADCKAIIEEQKSKGWHVVYKCYVGNHYFKIKFGRKI